MSTETLQAIKDALGADWLRCMEVHFGRELQFTIPGKSVQVSAELLASQDPVSFVVSLLKS